jgi:hypothetical protein
VLSGRGRRLRANFPISLRKSGDAEDGNEIATSLLSFALHHHSREAAVWDVKRQVCCPPRARHS